MNRLVRASMRSIAVFLALCCVAMVALPQSTPARGDAPGALAVSMMENSAKVPSATLQSVSQALYDGASSSGRFQMRGGGPLAIQPAATGDIMVSALGAANSAGADQVIIGDLVKSDGGSVAYRLTLFRVHPVQAMRSQFFTETYPPNDYRTLASKFSTDVATLTAPRNGTGTIYSLDGGVHADLGFEEGFHLGQRFNVLRNGNKTGEAEISQITASDAVVSISNASGGYSPAVGDRLVSQDSVTQSVAGAAPGGSGGLGAIGALLAFVAVGLAVSHKGGTAASPQPSSSPSTSFIVNCVTDGLNPPGYTCTFNKAVQNPGSCCFSDITRISVVITTGGVTQPAEPLANFAGGSQAFDATSRVLTFRAASLLPTNTTVQVNFSNLILSTDNTALTPNSFSNSFAVVRRPLTIPSGPRRPIN